LKPVFVISSLIIAPLIGCGGSGSTSPAAGPASTGNIQISMHPGSPSLADTLEAQPQTQTGTLPEPTTIRFVVTNPGTGFSSLEDIPVANTQTVDIPVPEANGYVLDVISSKADPASQEYLMLKSAEATGINVAANTTTSVTMVLAPLSATITPPATASEGDSIQIACTTPACCESQLILFTSTAPFPGYTQTEAATGWFGTGTSSLTALTAYDGGGNAVPGNMYFQGFFYLKPALATESGPMWIYVYPNPSYGDAQVGCPLTVPSGGISVGVTY